MADVATMKHVTLVVATVVIATVTAVTAAASVPGAAGVDALLRGVPQHGVWLGRPTAPVVLVEYVDLQCPYCAAFSKRTLPPLIRGYVRTGKVRILFRGMAFLGADSVTALRWTFGAAGQNKLWNVLELLYRAQGSENSGWVTPRLLASVAAAVPGLNVAKLRRDAARADFQIAAAAAAAKTAKVPGTPYLEVGRSLSTLQPLRLESFDPQALAAAFDHLLR
jgi:protein-disulfide isomerase